MDPLTECREDLEDWDPEHDPLLCTAPYHPECFVIRETEAGRAAGEVFAEALSQQERCRARLFICLLERDLQVLMQACQGRRNALLRIATAVEKEHRVLSAIGQQQHLPLPAERFPVQEALLYTDSILNRTHHLAISIPRILHKIDRLTAKLNAYRYPVLTLPSEIVATIFCLSETSPSALQLSQICSSWRVIAHQTHKLWTSVRIKLTASSVGSADILDEWMERSGTLGLDIVLREQTAKPVEKAAVMAIVHRHWARVRSFDVICMSSTLGYLSGKAECLLSVNITLVDYPVQSQVTLWDLERNAPHLQILVSKTLYYKTLSFPHRSVTHVISERDPCSLDSNELLVLLRCFVVIEHASFRLKETESDTVITALPAGFQPIILDRLDTLEVTEGHAIVVDPSFRTPRPFSRFLHVPNLKRLALPEIWFESDGVADIRLLLCVSRQLQEVTFHLAPHDELDELQDYYRRSLRGLDVHMNRDHLPAPKYTRYGRYSSD